MTVPHAVNVAEHCELCFQSRKSILCFVQPETSVGERELSLWDSEGKKRDSILTY